MAEVRVTQMGAYAESEGSAVQATQLGAYAEMVQREVRATQVGVYAELSEILLTPDAPGNLTAECNGD